MKERSKQRQFDLDAGEIVQFTALPGVRKATRVEELGRSKEVFDLFWNAGIAYVVEGMETEQVIEKLKPKIKKDYLEIRLGSSLGWAQSILVTGPSGREYNIEGTQLGMEALMGLLRAQHREALKAPEAPSKWVPSEWKRYGKLEEMAGKVKKASGKAELVCLDGEL